MGARWPAFAAGPLLLAVAAGVLLAGCEDGSPPLSDVMRAQIRWGRDGSDGYTVESRYSCFCYGAGRWVRLTVRGNEVVAVLPLDEWPEDLDPLQGGWKTVDQLFDTLLAPPGDYIESVLGTFDPELGYPLSVVITCVPEIADCNSEMELRNLRIP